MDFKERTTKSVYVCVMFVLLSCRPGRPSAFYSTTRPTITALVVLNTDTEDNNVHNAPLVWATKKMKKEGNMA